MKRLIILVVVAGLGLSACTTGAARTLEPVSNEPGPVNISPSPKPAKNAPPKAKKTSKPPKEQGPGSPSAPKSRSCSSLSGGSEGSVAQLVDVRVGAHDDYDRVTFEFAPPSDGRHFGLPPFEIHAAKPPITQDGSGAPVAVEGERFAVIVFHGASGVDSTADEYRVTYDGPKEFTPGYEALAEATQTGDYEATLSWAFGLDSDSCWTLLELEGPLRLAVDFSH